MPTHLSRPELFHEHHLRRRWIGSVAEINQTFIYPLASRSTLAARDDKLSLEETNSEVRSWREGIRRYQGERVSESKGMYLTSFAMRRGHPSIVPVDRQVASSLPPESLITHSAAINQWRRATCTSFRTCEPGQEPGVDRSVVEIGSAYTKVNSAESGGILRVGLPSMLRSSSKRRYPDVSTLNVSRLATPRSSYST